MIPESQATGIEKELIDILRNMWDDDEFVTGTRLYLKTDEDREWMIEAIKEKEVATPSDVALYSVQLYRARQKQTDRSNHG